MNIENAKTQMLKGVFEYCILSLIQKRDMYASEIIDAFTNTQLDLVEGTIYPILTRLKNSEYLSYYWQESTQGPPRKYFQITQKGEEFLVELKKIWIEISGAVADLTSKNVK